MTITVHHLHKSQSERIIWLLEELNVPYELVIHERNPETALAQAPLKAVHQAGTAPVMVDDPSPTNGGKVVIAESGAIVEYIIAVHGGGRLALTPKDKTYADYVNWFHFSNATLQATAGRVATVKRLGIADDNRIAQVMKNKFENQLDMVEQQLQKTGSFMAGDQLTAADIMIVFTLTTMRGFFPVDLSKFTAILGYLQRVGERDAYKKAIEKGDPGMTPLLGPTVKPFAFSKF